MRALIALTVFMGVLIIAGLVVIVVTIVHRLSAPKPPVPIAGPATAGQATAGQATAGHATIPVPAGARVEAMTAVGERLVLRVATAQGGETLITLDPASGAVLETIDLIPDTLSGPTPAEHP